MWFAIAILVLLAAVVIYDVTQRKHAILRNFPIVGHFRYWLETIGPELRQYIVTSNDEERPFSRDQRRWVYASSKLQNNYFGFGTDNDLEQSNSYFIIKQSAFPLPEPHPGTPDYDPMFRLPCAKVLGRWRGRRGAFRPQSVVNVSGMSYGSLSWAAVEALNRGCAKAGALQNTGEGGISRHHLHGGELIWQIGTGYFGCRNDAGQFSLPKLVQVVETHPQVRAIEIKLSQGAKAGLGGIVPGRKVTEEVAKIRGIPAGQTCISPAAHTAFSDVDSMLDFIEEIADITGLPVGIKSAVGDMDFWRELAEQMAETKRGPDYITIDGGEGGTGAAPLAFTDHVALPFKLGFSRVYKEFARVGMHENVVFIGSGKLGFPDMAMFAFGLGVDMVNVGREAMLAIGCIQAQRCHTDHCPTGVATHKKWLVRGLDPLSKGDRTANYLITLRNELTLLSRVCGVPHPGLVTSRMFEIIDDRFGGDTIEEIFGYSTELGVPSKRDQEEIREVMEELTRRH